MRKPVIDIDRQTFFTYVRRAPFGNRLTQQQVDGIKNIVDTFLAAPGTSEHDYRHLAYILATVFHETGGTMAPVREGFAKSDAAARKIVAGRKYGKPDLKTGLVYYGRGYVQLTWADNYGRMGKLLDLPLYENPDLALEPDVAADILIEGMCAGRSRRGDFTGKSLQDFFNETTDDPIGARKIINGVDKASLVATYHEQFLAALKAADTHTPLPADTTPEAARADAPPLTTDRSTLGWLTSVVGAGGLGTAGSMLGSIDNPWTFGAFALVAVIAAVGAGLYFSGRLRIRHEAGA